MKKVVKLFLFLVISLGILAASEGSKDIDVNISVPRVDFIENFGYRQTTDALGQTIQLNMDILKPVSNKPLPAVLYVTGGGFLNAPKGRYIQQRLAIAEAGYVVASIEYRVVPQTVFPGPLEDVKSAIRYLKSNAKKFRIDPNKVVIMGDSAGGYLSAMVGTTNKMKEFEKDDYLDQNSDVVAAIDIYGLSDLTKIGDGYSQVVQDMYKLPNSPNSLFVNGVAVFSGGPGGGIESNMKKANAANPITYISKNTPPFLIMHGEKDSLVSPKQTELLYNALVEKGVKSTRYVVKNAAHADIYWNQPEVVDIIIKFLNETVK